jgi:hypothetical protein
MTGHLALCMNDGAPDVAVINYNVFNRDGVYVANVLQKAGRPDLAALAIDYFLAHPFNGRTYPEADNPGQILWIMGEYWRFSRDVEWLRRVFPSAQKLGAMVRYYRTTPGPHWVHPDRLDFGDALSPSERQELKPGRCDGDHPEYTEAFDLAGLFAMVTLSRGMGSTEDITWGQLLAMLEKSYDQRFGRRLAKDYGAYAVLWPCRVYPLQQGKAFDQFKNVGLQRPKGYRYFPLATAHQGLLAGNRAAGHATLEAHWQQDLMRGWYVLDEGGESGVGAWKYVRTNWKPTVAMPHGWAIAEFALLLRDCLLFEDGNRLVLLAGTPEDWFTRSEGMSFKHMPTHFGSCSLSYTPDRRGARLTLSGATPPEGFVLRMPKAMRTKVTVDKSPAKTFTGDVILPSGTKLARLEFLSK